MSESKNSDSRALAEDRQFTRTEVRNIYRALLVAAQIEETFDQSVHVFRAAKYRKLMTKICSMWANQRQDDRAHAIREAKIDAAFTEMGNDEEYQATAARLVEEFSHSDWDALRDGEEVR